MERFVYVLKLKNEQYYVGSTNDLARRFVDHKTWHTITTKRIPVEEMKFHRKYETKNEARKIEMFLKKQKSRILIEKFMTDSRKNT
jgi:predicted GIY-YIG superfamily endonuclease